MLFSCQFYRKPLMLCCVCAGRPIFGICQSTSHTTYSTAYLSLFPLTETLKQEEGLNLFLRPSRSPAAPKWTGYPVQPLESTVLPSRSCWNISHDMSTHEWFKKEVKYGSCCLQPSPFCREVVFMHKEQHMAYMLYGPILFIRSTFILTQKYTEVETSFTK